MSGEVLDAANCCGVAWTQNAAEMPAHPGVSLCNSPVAPRFPCEWKADIVGPLDSAAPTLALLV